MRASQTPETTLGREPGPLQQPGLSDAAGPPGAAGRTPSARPVRIPFDNTYARLPERFYARRGPVLVAAPRLIRVNAELAGDLVDEVPDDARLKQSLAIAYDRMGDVSRQLDDAATAREYHA